MPVKSTMEASRETERDVVVFTVAVEVANGNKSAVAFSWMMASEAATEPLGKVRTPREGEKVCLMLRNSF